MTNLESVFIGARSFQNLESFSLSHNPKLSVFEIEDGYMKDDGRVCDCAFLKVYELKLIGMYWKLLINWIDLPSLTALKFGFGSFYLTTNVIIESIL